ncbi:MAG TPA: pyridoxal-dependent decarboxylase, partial [Fimbriimonas sp.]|nr:pyridoxal-dependent decarboxylase [Fimbriimonas sp.]
EKGNRPAVILGTAGTVNTGATDDLNALADIAAEEDLWLHIDGAFGALAAISPNLSQTVRGMERADSLAFDLHKWMYLPFEIACLLVRDGDVHRAAFTQSASYIAPSERGVIAGGLPFADLGIELTRGFKALKAWMCLKSYGFDKMAALIDQNVEQARLLASLVEAHPELELMAPVPLNVVCFRYKAPQDGVDRFNEEILYLIQERGIAVPSSTILNGAYCLRACFVNHRTKMEDVPDLVRAVVEIGREVESKG